MKKFSKVPIIALSAIALTIGVASPSTSLAATAPNLGAAESYALFGKAGITNSGASTQIWGNVGADDVDSITGLIAGQTDGVINTGAGVGAAALAAYGNLAGQAATDTLDLAGTNTITPGVYTIGASTLNGTLTLNGGGVYIFQSSSSISVSAGAKMILTNGAAPCNVFWQIPTSMTIGAGAQMVGTIITNTGAITLGDSTRLQGRAISLVTQVTLINNQITEAACTTSSLTSPGIKVRKEASKTSLQSGPDKVTFTYKVTNDGSTPLSDISLKDDKCDDVNFDKGDDNSDEILDLDEEWKYTCKKTVKETETNIATAKGTGNGERVKDTDEVKVTVSTPGLPNAGVSNGNLWESISQKISSMYYSLLK